MNNANSFGTSVDVVAEFKKSGEELSRELNNLLADNSISQRQKTRLLSEVRVLCSKMMQAVEFSESQFEGMYIAEGEENMSLGEMWEIRVSGIVTNDSSEKEPAPTYLNGSWWVDKDRAKVVELLEKLEINIKTIPAGFGYDDRLGKFQFEDVFNLYRTLSFTRNKSQSDFFEWLHSTMIEYMKGYGIRYNTILNKFVKVD